MPELNLERLDEFCAVWRQKADGATTESVAGLFDRFFALWIVFNRLYAEVARLSMRECGGVRGKLGRRGPARYGPPPDRFSATKGVVDFCGNKTLLAALAESHSVSESIESTLHAVDCGLLYLHENYETGQPDYERDRQIIVRVRSGDVCALLELTYQARCNLFHGQKAYSEVQRPLLEGLNNVIAVAIDVTLVKLRQRSKGG